VCDSDWNGATSQFQTFLKCRRQVATRCDLKAIENPGDAKRGRIGTLGPALATVWSAATTTARDRKELIGTLIEEVIVKVERDKSAAHLTLRWKGGALTEIDLALPRKRPATVRTARCPLTERQLRHRRLPPPPPGSARPSNRAMRRFAVSFPRTTRREPPPGSFSKIAFPKLRFGPIVRMRVNVRRSRPRWRPPSLPRA
jgi:hypothetical protein